MSMQHSTTRSPASSPPQAASPRRFVRPVVIAFCAALLLYFPISIGMAGLQVYGAVQRIVARGRALDPASSRAADWADLHTDAAALARATTRLAQRIRPVLPLLHRLEFVPRYGPLLATSGPTLDTALQATSLLEQALARVVAAEGVLDGPGAWVHLGSVLAPLADEVTALEAQLAALPATEATAVGRRLRQLHAGAELGAVALALGDAWPDLLGTTRPTTYLILIQNNHELRATGGFISALAPATWRAGTLSPVEFVDSYAIFDDDLAYPPAPPPMQAYMDIELLTLRDGNWSPDLPTSARLIRTLYQQHTGLAVDGVITVDLDAVALLLSAFGELQLADLDAPITAANVEQALVELWNDPLAAESSAATPDTGDWWSQRKDFVGQLAEVALARLQAGDVDPAALAAGMVAALDRRAVQVVFFDPAAQGEMAARGWDGGLHPPADGDFVAVVDTNVGYNKVDAVLARHMEYAVTWPDPADAADTTDTSDTTDTAAIATLTLTYTHPLNVRDPVCAAKPYYGARYEDMMARCYFDYSRVFVPAGSELVDAQGWLDGTVTSSPGPAGTRQLAGYFVLNPGSRHRVTLRYRLPPSIRRDNYRVVIQRQAGTDPLPVTLAAEAAQVTTTVVEGKMTWPPGESR